MSIFSPSNHSTNLAGRMGRWSAQHRKIAIFGWLAFVLASFAIAPPAVRPLRNVALRLLAHVPPFRRRLAEQLSAIGHR